MLLPLTLKVKLYLVLLMALLPTTFLFSQINNAFPSYAIGKNALAEDLFYQYDQASNNWIEIAKSTNGSITAITSDPSTKQVYAVKENSFGTIDPANGQFVSIANFEKSIKGEFGELIVTSIEAMCFDVFNQIIYAVHRLNGLADVLLMINPKTGKIVENHFIVNESDEVVDYQVLEELELDGKVFDIAADITVHPHSGQLYVMYQHSEEFCLVVSDKSEGSIIAPLFEISNKSIKNFEFSSKGELFAIAEDHNTNESHVYHVDHENGSIIPVSQIGENTDVQFTAVEFVKPYNDIALKIELSPGNTMPLTPGDNVLFDIEIINQGEIDINYVQIVNYLTPGLIIKNESDWHYIDDDFSLLDVEELIMPKQSLKKQVQFIVSQTFEGTIANFAEVNLYVNTYTERGLPLVWPDIDSTADSKNDELIYIDNEINQGGRLVSEDEDDHDLVMVNVNSNCITHLTFENEVITSALYEVGDHIYAENTNVEAGTILKAGRSVIMNKGFEVAANANFEAHINFCE